MTDKSKKKRNFADAMHRTRFPYILLCLMALTLAVGCSVKKNTASRRAYHAMTTRFNVMYNGQVAYNEGLDAIDKANKDDYTQVLPMYTSGNHDALSAGTSKMERALEKCRKSIKLHSIQKKPKYDPKKAHDPKYKMWLEQEEFNPALYMAWLMQGKAEFHTGDYLGCVATMNYVVKHYEHDRDVVAQAQLWAVRAYIELDWLYEAEDLMARVNQDEMKPRNAWLYSATEACLLLKKQEYKAAIPYLQQAAKNEKRRIDRTRMMFILGQLHEQAGNRSDAIECYTNVVKAFNTVDMEFNARLRRAALQGDDKALKDLKKMSRDYKNKDRLDQVYGAVADIYLARKDTTAALAYLRTAIDTATTAGAGKLRILLEAADLYYALRDYRNAEPCYTEAATLISNTADDYQRVRQRSQALNQLIAESDKAHLQDSLQQLAQMSEEQRREVLQKMIDDMQQAAYEAQQRAEQEARQAQNNAAAGGGGLMGLNTANMLGGGGSAEWYFYNANLLRQGKQEFLRQWGMRKLEDDWRHSQKTTMPFADDMDSDMAEQEPLLDEDGNPIPPDSTVLAAQDPNNVEFYLRQVPLTEEQIEASNMQWADALYNMGFIYLDQIDDKPMADATFDELLRRFPQSTHTLDTYYTRYVTALRDSDNAEAERWRQQIISRYPDSRQASMLANADYMTQLRLMLTEQDSVYEQTYLAYQRGQYNAVKANVDKARDNYSMSPLMPRFLFLGSLATAKTGTRDQFGDRLRELVEQYPQAEVSAMAKDMLALMGQGLENQHSTSGSTLQERHEQEQEQQTEQGRQGFSDEIDTRFVLLIVIDKQQSDISDDTSAENEPLNRLLYQVAFYNFSQFMIKDFDLDKRADIDAEHQALAVSGLDSYRELMWYIEQITSDADLRALFDELGARPVPISETNLQLLRQGYTLQQYQDFWQSMTE